MDPERTRHARGLFAGIAPEYDRMGAALSFGRGPGGRRRLGAGGGRGVAARGLPGRVHFALGQAQAVPFADEAFDAVTFTYLLRYVHDPSATVAELVRTLRPGGVMASLEFHVPPEPWARAGWHAYTRAGVPVLGWTGAPARVREG